MPNWCNNKLTVCGPAADVKRFRRRAVGCSPWTEKDETPESVVLNFHNLVPIPPDVLAAGYEAAGYDWERQHWGCKWGACHAELTDEWDGHLVYTFDTAWTPPLPFLKHLGPQWPTLRFVVAYEEWGVGFQGLCKVQGAAVEDRGVIL
jgi:hypothetical protein